ncbi:MAG: NosD domain-containing protein, partial [Isosphaerales bacterium]
GQTVRIFLDAGSQPVFGTESPTLSYVRVLGFTIEPTSTYTSGGILEVASPFRISGTSDEVAYCEIIGQYAATTDNHDGIRLDSANSAWIHNNNIHGVTGGGGNSAGIKVYGSSDIIVEDNYIHGCTSGIFDKEGGNQNTYRRNYLTNNTDLEFIGNNQGTAAILYIYDNVVDGEINLQFVNDSNQVYNNLIRTSDSYNGKVTGIQAQNPSTNAQVWNNIILSEGQAVWGYVDANENLTDSPPPLSYMNYNVYDSSPSYGFGLYLSNPVTYSLSQFQGQGFEQHAQVVSSDLSIFQDLTSYVLLTQWTTAGRYGDPVGPRYPVAQILNTSRYGPGSLSTGISPIITQQPQNQTVSAGGSATFSVQVNGSGLLYQWQSSSDGGNTWMTIQGASSAAYTITQVTTTESGAVFRCLVSSVGGSAWSNPATLTVTGSNNAIVNQSSIRTVMAAPTAALGVVANGTVSAAATPALTYSLQTVSASPVAAQNDGVDPGSSPAFVQNVNLSPAQPAERAKTRPGQISRHRKVPVIASVSAHHPRPSRVRWAKEFRPTHQA